MLQNYQFSNNKLNKLSRIFKIKTINSGCVMARKITQQRKYRIKLLALHLKKFV